MTQAQNEMQCEQNEEREEANKPEQEGEAEGKTEEEKLKKEKEAKDKRREEMKEMIRANKYCPFTKDEQGHCIPCTECKAVRPKCSDDK